MSKEVTRDELIDALIEARGALWHALDHLDGCAAPDTAPTIKELDALLDRLEAAGEI